MPLTAFMKTSDPNRISKITPDLSDRSRGRKLFVPLRAVGEEVYEKIFVADCQTHVGGVSVPVHIRRWDGKAFAEVGIARCCPLCWRMLVGPDGEIDPPVKPQTMDDVDAVMKMGRKERTKTKKEVQAAKSSGPKFDVPALSLWAKDLEVFETYDVMAAFGVGRSSALNIIALAIRIGRIEYVTQGAGRGSRSSFRVVQKKEA